MPFTPFHMGPGLLAKAVLQGSFSLMVFGWAQIVMDLQPLAVLITGRGHLHGFSHTYLGAALLGGVCALSGKYLAQVGLWMPRLVGINCRAQVTWPVACFSAFAGTFSHVALDSIMHRDVQPWAPFATSNALLGIISVPHLHQLCVYTSLAGACLYGAIRLARQPAAQRLVTRWAKPPRR